jgi:Tfp pilus assembly protein PilF
MYDDKGAINDLSKAIELDPTNTDAYVSRALVNIIILSEFRTGS